ncbi:MAG TPA: carotenoid biosynthesis protein, partial [Verrucomicrobiae bacterium]|nr:carotenoid biosynthesis protein [Verrucomicrobiae bacterium]
SAPRFPTLCPIRMRLSENTRNYVFWALNGLLNIAFIVELRASNYPSWLDGATIGLAAVTSIIALNRQLPLQNVLSAAAITATIGGLVHGFSARTAIPLGPIVFNSQAGPQLFNAIPWTIPLLWIVAIFSARGVGRLILRPWRKVKIYGYWLIAVTSVLVLAFDIALEPYAWHVKHLWLWQPTKLLLNWHGASLLNFIGWGFTALLILMFITPSLIRKQPGGSGTMDFHPLIVWLGALLLFAVGSAGTHLWWAVGVDAAIATITTALVIRGAKW